MIIIFILSIPQQEGFSGSLRPINYVNGTPAVSNNNIVFGGCDGIIRIADAYSGREKDTIEIGIYIASSPALSGGKACFGDYDGNLYCVDLLTGKIVWKVPASENIRINNGNTGNRKKCCNCRQ